MTVKIAGSGYYIEKRPGPLNTIHHFGPPALERGVLDVGCGLTPIGDVNVDREVISDETGSQIWGGVFNADLRRSYRTRLDVRAIGEALPFQDNSFSAVWSSDSIEHTTRPQAFLEECIRVSRRLVVIVTPHYYGRGSKLPIHRSRFKRRDLERMLQAVQDPIAWRFHTTLHYINDRVKIPLFRPGKIILHIFKNVETGPLNTLMGVQT